MPEAGLEPARSRAPGDFETSQSKSEAERKAQIFIVVTIGWGLLSNQPKLDFVGLLWG